MSLERWIALILLLICLVYGYQAFFAMDGLLPPIMKRNPVWPSSFPKILSVLAVFLCSFILLKSKPPERLADGIDYRRLTDYKLTQALLLIACMIVYAFALRPLGFLVATFGFLCVSPMILGEKRYLLVIATASVASFAIWYLVDGILGIFLNPYPAFLMN